MKKIPTLFKRDPDNPKHVTNEVNPECQWVLDGEGVPTRKWDGTCVRVNADGAVWMRREVKPGKEVPPAFTPVETDPNTGKTVGWEPYEQTGFAAFVREATEEGVPAPGTYELCGPKINGNPEGLERHALIPHGLLVLDYAPRDHDALREYLLTHAFEGIVWHHPDGRMVKLKRRDFA